ncbi:MAG: SDR family oxidoreductase [Roseivivax sp.]|nr:SDR family oxidoreductase [Roseivivax sp.]
MTGTLLTLGHGYSSTALAELLIPQGWRVMGTTRSADRAGAIAATGVEPVLWQAEPLALALAQADHLLISAAPGPEGDPALALIGPQIAAHAPRLRWAGYLSTTAVYGDHAGGWVDETTALTPAAARGKARVAAEAAWAGIAGMPLHIFRLAGIYGPGRGPFAKLRAGKAQRVVKPGQVFSRIHVDDIAQVLAASIARPNPGAAYNLCDDDPAPPQDVLLYAAELMGVDPPPEVPFDQAELGPMARSFYAESKRVRNDLIKQELGIALRHPDYRSGLRAVMAAEAAEGVVQDHGQSG